MRKCTLMIGLILTISTHVRAADPAGLVGCWDFSEEQGDVAHDGSGMGNHGLIHGAKRISGDFGFALWFDGVDDYVEVKDAPSLNLKEQLTLEAWVNADKIFHAAKIICKHDKEGPGGYWLDQIHGARMCLYVGDSAAGPPYLRAASRTYLSPGRWFHIIGTYDRGTMRIYINGKFEGHEKGPAHIGDTQGRNLLIGSYDPGGIYRWTGMIAEPRVYNRVLTPEEIETRFKMTAPRYLGEPSAWTIDFSPDTVLVWAGLEQHIRVTVYNHGDNPMTGRISYEILDFARRRIMQGKSKEIEVSPKSRTQFSFPFEAKISPGQLFLRCWWGEDQRSAWQHGMLCVEPPKKAPSLRRERRAASLVCFGGTNH